MLECYNISHFKASTFTCEYCSSIISGTYWLEHILPLSKNGDNELVNLAITCKGCNLNKLAKKLEEWKPELVSYFKERNKKWNEI